VCTDGKGAVQALFWDFTITHPGPSVNNQVYYNKDLPAQPAGPAHLKIQGLRKGAYQLKAYKVGYRSNDAYTSYIDLGSPAQLTRAQVAKLKEVSAGAAFQEETVQVDASGVFERSYSLLQNDAVLVVLTPAP
jgi:xylan 1,4-beta-xylosidase